MLKRNSAKLMVLMLMLAFVFTAGQAQAFDTVVGEADVDLEADRPDIRTRETNLGNMVADIFVEATGADMAFMNGGGIRNTVAAGEITLENVMEIHPFENMIATMELTGEEVIEVLEHGVSQHPEHWGGFPQISKELSFKFNTFAEPGERVQKVWYEGEEIDPEEEFIVAGSDFIFAGGDDYEMLEEKEVIEEFVTIDQAIIDHLDEHSPVAPEVDGRIFSTLSMQPAEAEEDDE